MTEVTTSARRAAPGRRHSSTLDEQLLAAIKSVNKPSIRLDADADGNVLIDKEKHPQVYDWAVNG